MAHPRHWPGAPGALHNKACAGRPACSALILQRRFRPRCFLGRFLPKLGGPAQRGRLSFLRRVTLGSDGAGHVGRPEPHRSGLPCVRSLLVAEQSAQPSRMPAASSQARSAATGQWAVSGLAATWTRTPSPSWSALERGSSTLSPCGPKERSATRIITSSARRKAPAKPSRMSARSRSPRRSPATGRGDPQHVGGEQRRRLALGPAAVAAGDALQGPAQDRVARVERLAQEGVRLDDGGEPAGQGGVGALAGELRQVVGDQGRRGGAGEGAVVLAPGLPGAQMAGVGAAGRGRK